MGDMADWILDQGMMLEVFQFDEPLKGERMAVVKRKMPEGDTKKKRVGRSDGPSLEVTLPTQRSVPSGKLEDYTILLFGEKKIGKTDLTAQFPNAVHLMTEPGGKAQAIYQREVRNWREFIAYVKLLRKDTRFANVVVDTADILYGYAFDHEMNRLGVDHPSDEAYGKGWKAIRDEFEKWVMALIHTGKGVIFVSHATEREIKMRDGAKYDRITPTMSGQARDVLEGVVDLWFYYGYDGHRRVLTIQGSDHIGAGHRLKKNFLSPTGKPLAEIDMGENAEESYANLIAAFKNTYVPSTPAPEESEGKVVKKKLSLKKGAK
jgi:hypothetical protein